MGLCLSVRRSVSSGSKGGGGGGRGAQGAGAKYVENGGKGGQVLFFPDAGMPCRQYMTVRYWVWVNGLLGYWVTGCGVVMVVVVVVCGCGCGGEKVRRGGEEGRD